MSQFTILAQADTTPLVERPAPVDQPASDTDPAAQQTVTVQPGTPPTTQQVDPPWWTQPMLPILIGIMVLYFLMFRSRKGKDKQRQSLLEKLKKGDRVQTIGGIIGTVIEARETEVLLKVDETSNTKIRFSRNAIHRVLDEDNKSETR